MKKTKITIANTEEVRAWVSASLGTISHEKLNLLFGGTRLSCCDEVVVIKDKRRIVAATSLAPFGEERNPGMEKMARDPQFAEAVQRVNYAIRPAEPTIVGVFVLPNYRGQGFGRQIMEAAIRRCIERSLIPTKIDLMSTGIKHIVDTLPTELRQHLLIRDHGGILDHMPG